MHMSITIKKLSTPLCPSLELAIIIPYVLPENTKKNKERKDGRLLFYRNLNNFDQNCFIEDMCSCSWADIKNCITPDESLKVWSTLYNNVQDKHMPIIQKRVKRLQQPRWMNKEIKFAIHTRDYMKKRQYKIWRNRVVNLIPD